MTFDLGRLAQVIHVTDDLAAARRLYGEVLGGELYYEGYSPYEKRDASIYAIGDATIEPMSPSDEQGALDFPVGRFLTRFGPKLHSIAINTTGVRELAEHLVAAGIRVVGPGGIPISELSDEGPISIYTHPRDSHLLIEFVDFGAPLMPASPRLSHGWDVRRRAEAHPAGVLGPSHATVVVTDLDRALGFFREVLGTPVLVPPADACGCRSARVRLGTEMVVELAQPTELASEMARSLEGDGEGLYSLTLEVIDIDRAVTYLDEQGIATTRELSGELSLDPSSTAGGRLTLNEASPERLASG